MTALVVVVLGVVLVVTKMPGTKVPSPEVLGKLPRGTQVVFDRVISGTGSLEQDDRLLGLYSEDRDSAALIRSMVSHLEREGWDITDRTGAGIAPDGTCLGMRPAVDFLEDPNQVPSERHAVESAFKEHGDRLVVAVLSFC